MRTPGVLATLAILAGALAPGACANQQTVERLTRANEIIRTQGVKPRERYDAQVLARGRRDR